MARGRAESAVSKVGALPGGKIFGARHLPRALSRLAHGKQGGIVFGWLRCGERVEV